MKKKKQEIIGNGFKAPEPTLSTEAANQLLKAIFPTALRRVIDKANYDLCGTYDTLEYMERLLIEEDEKKTDDTVHMSVQKLHDLLALLHVAKLSIEHTQDCTLRELQQILK